VAYGRILIVGLGVAVYAGEAVLRDRGAAASSTAAAQAPILGDHPAEGGGRAVLPDAVDAAGSGVPILDGLDITARTAGNAIIEDAIQTTRTSIERGETISAPLRETNVFPPMVVQMINVGETTGALDAMLAKIADFYEEEVDTAVAGLLTLMEPVMIAFLGGIVGGIVIAMYLPIFDLISQLT
jgi:type IV pilus assembly protein PilC